MFFYVHHHINFGFTTPFRNVFIPRIVFIPQDNEYPFSWQRRQFPVKPAFATTINKSQGNILGNILFYLKLLHIKQ